MTHRELLAWSIGCCGIMGDSAGLLPERGQAKASATHSAPEFGCASAVTGLWEVPDFFSCSSLFREGMRAPKEPHSGALGSLLRVLFM